MITINNLRITNAGFELEAESGGDLETYFAGRIETWLVREYGIFCDVEVRK